MLFFMFVHHHASLLVGTRFEDSVSCLHLYLQVRAWIGFRRMSLNFYQPIALIEYSRSPLKVKVYQKMTLRLLLYGRPHSFSF